MKKETGHIIVQIVMQNYLTLLLNSIVEQGWPSFTEALPGAFKTKIDYSFGMKRTEYHCAKCGAHHGHVFNDGPGKSGKRYCNNGLCLIFIPK